MLALQQEKRAAVNALFCETKISPGEDHFEKLFQLRFVIVHNHFRPGGVRRVIEEVTPHIVKVLRPRVDEVVLATGEMPGQDWLANFRRSLGPIPVSCHAEKAFGYFVEQPCSPAVVSKQVRGALEKILGEKCVVWAHNQGLARNLFLTRELHRICAQRKLLLTFHHHDWWFDNRWQRWQEMRKAGVLALSQIAEAVFIGDRNVRHAAINQIDARVLQRYFPGQTAWLPNTVATRKPAAARVRQARAWLKEQVGEDAPVWLMPCRLLRRKNIAEALLLTRWLRSEAWLITTGGISSTDEQKYAARLKSAAEKNGWRLRLGALQENENSKPSVPELLAASEAVLLTSCQEGFGLPFLEAAAARRPLICRSLPNVAPDLAQFGLRFPQEYSEVLVDPRLFDWRAEQLRQQRIFDAFRRKLPHFYQKLAGAPALLRAGRRPCPVPFSRLTLSAQLEVLVQPVAWSFHLCALLNPHLSKWRKLAEEGALGVSQWPGSDWKTLSGAMYAQRFAKLLAAKPKGRVKPGGGVAAQDEFIRQKLQSENLYPLTWASRT